MGGVDTSRRDEAAPRGGDAQGELLPVARRDGAGGEGRRVEGARGRPGDGDTSVPQGRPPRARRRRRHAVRGAYLLPARAFGDGGERPPLVLDVRACRRLLRATQRPEPRDGQLPKGAGVRPRRRALAPLLPGARGGGAGAAVGRPSGEPQEERRGDRALCGGRGGAEGGRGGDPVPPVGEGGAGGRDPRPDRGAALLPADSEVLRGRAQLRRRRALLPPRRAAAGRRRDVLEGKQVGARPPHRDGTHEPGGGRDALHHAGAPPRELGQVQGGGAAVRDGARARPRDQHAQEGAAVRRHDPARHVVP